MTVRFVPFRDAYRPQPDVSCESVALPLLYVHCPARTDNTGKQTISTARTNLHVFMSTFLGFICVRAVKSQARSPLSVLSFTLLFLIIIAVVPAQKREHGKHQKKSFWVIFLNHIDERAVQY